MISTAILVLLSLAFAVMGVGALIAPTVVTRQFGTPALTAEGRSEVRAVYGGFGLAIAAMLDVAAVNADLRTGIALTVSVALFGMAAGRVVSAVVDRSLARVALLYLVIEAVGATMLLAVVLLGGGP